jgi:hypothetical protein
LPGARLPDLLWRLSGQQHAQALDGGYGLHFDGRWKTVGPLANERRLHAMDSLIADAVQHGATIETGGHRIGNKGYFFEPTVLARHAPATGGRAWKGRAYRRNPPARLLQYGSCARESGVAIDILLDLPTTASA